MSAFGQSINEACGLFGIWNSQQAAELSFFALHALQHRGQASAGIVSLAGAEMNYHKGQGLLAEVFMNPADLTQLKGTAALGHVRHALQAQAKDLANVQPLLFQFSEGPLAVCHNGNLTNYQSLRRKLEAKGAIFQSESDAELLVHLMRHSVAADFEGQLSQALSQLRGGFVFGLLTPQGLYGAVDSHSFRPLVLGQTEDGAYVLASETCALHAIGADFVRNIHAGQWVRIDEEGYEVKAYTQASQVAIEAMEFIYFARPDSDIAGINVHSARKNTGRQLFKEAPCPTADMVVGVPNSSLSAASGYAEAAGLPYEMGLIKNQYVHRTFIESTQELRDLGVRRKLSAVRGVVQGQSVVLVDDSIVRGTTSRRLIELLRQAGAKEVHLRISSPPFRFPNFYGIDVSTSADLIAADRTVKEIEAYLGCDSLAYLSVEGLVEAIGTQFEAPYRGLCTAAFTGDYPATLEDYEASFYSQLTDLQIQMIKGEKIDESSLR